MPSNIPIGYGQATFSLRHESLLRPLAITLGVALPDPGVDPVEVANALHDRFRLTILTDLDNSIALQWVDLFIGNGNDPSGSVRSNIGSFPGERSMVSVPLNTAVLVEKRSGFLGRTGRGRMFVPSSAATTEVSEIGNLNGGLRTSLQQRWNEFYSELVDDEGPHNFFPGAIQPVILHQSPTAGAPTPISGFQVQTKVGTRATRIR